MEEEQAPDPRQEKREEAVKAAFEKITSRLNFTAPEDWKFTKERIESYLWNMAHYLLPDDEPADLVPAGELESGEFFRKQRGTYVYLVISESSAKFYGLDPANVYGVGFNGNVARVPRDRKVHRADIAELEENYLAQREWSAAVGIE